MLSFRTIVPHTLELLKHLMSQPYLQDCRPPIGNPASKAETFDVTALLAGLPFGGRHFTRLAVWSSLLC